MAPHHLPGTMLNTLSALFNLILTTILSTYGQGNDGSERLGNLPMGTQLDVAECEQLEYEPRSTWSEACDLNHQALLPHLSLHIITTHKEGKAQTLHRLVEEENSQLVCEHEASEQGSRDSESQAHLTPWPLRFCLFFQEYSRKGPVLWLSGQQPRAIFTYSTAIFPQAHEGQSMLHFTGGQSEAQRGKETGSRP